MKILCDCFHYKFFSTFGLRRPVGICMYGQQHKKARRRIGIGGLSL